MQNRFFIPILLVIALSVLGVISMQYYWLYNQYQDRKEELYRDAQKVILQVNEYMRTQLNSRVDIDDERLDELDYYYENPDSNFAFIFETIKRKRNKDGSDFILNDSIFSLRLNKMKKIVKDFEKDSANNPKKFEESFIILYGQDYKGLNKKKSWSHLLEEFEVDSCIGANLQNYGIEVDYDFGIRDSLNTKWEYLSEDTDSTNLLASELKGDFFEDKEQLYINLQETKSYLFRNMLFNLLLSTLLIGIILASFFYMGYIIWKQKQLSEIKTDFINNMTHEFKTPLATIAFAVANIDNPKVIKDENMVRQFTKVITEENKRMNRQVESVLNAALSDKKAFKLKKESIDIHEILNQLTGNIKMKLASIDATIDLQLFANQHVMNGDRQHLTNLFSNILDNAQKYSPSKIDIKVETKNINNGIQIRIEDKGLGMTNETIKKIFDKFYRVPTGDLHNIKGFGLGLSYAKAIVEQHGGQITATSKLNEGSTFIIYLPFSNNTDVE